MHIREVKLLYATPSQLVCSWSTSSRGPDTSLESSVQLLQGALERRYNRRSSPPHLTSFEDIRATNQCIWHFQYTPIWLGRWLEGGIRLRVPFVVLSELESGQRYRVRVRARGRSTNSSWGPWTESSSEFHTLPSSPLQSLNPRIPQEQRRAAISLRACEERASNWISEATRLLNPVRLPPMCISSIMLTVRLCMQCLLSSGLLTSPLLPLSCLSVAGEGQGVSLDTIIPTGPGTPINRSLTFSSELQSPGLTFTRRGSRWESGGRWCGLQEGFLETLRGPYSWGGDNDDVGGGSVISSGTSKTPFRTREGKSPYLALRYGRVRGAVGNEMGSTDFLGPEVDEILRGSPVLGTRGTPSQIESNSFKKISPPPVCQACGVSFMGPTCSTGIRRGGICFGCENYLCLKCRCHFVYVGEDGEDRVEVTEVAGRVAQGTLKLPCLPPSVTALPVCLPCLTASAEYCADLDRRFHNENSSGESLGTRLPPPFIILPHPNADEDRSLDPLHQHNHVATQQLQLVTASASPAFLLWLTSKTCASIRESDLFYRWLETEKSGVEGGGGYGVGASSDSWVDESIMSAAYENLEESEAEDEETNTKPPSKKYLCEVAALCGAVIETFQALYINEQLWCPESVQRGMAHAETNNPQRRRVPMSLPPPPTTRYCFYLSAFLTSPEMVSGGGVSSAVSTTFASAQIPPLTPKIPDATIQNATFPVPSFLHAIKSLLSNSQIVSSGRKAVEGLNLVGSPASPVSKVSASKAPMTPISSPLLSPQQQPFLTPCLYTPQPVYIFSDGRVSLPPPSCHPAAILAESLSKVPSILEYLLHTQRFSSDIASRPLALLRGSQKSMKDGSGRRRKGIPTVVYGETGECLEGAAAPLSPPHPSAAIDLIMDTTCDPPSPTFLYEFLHQARLDLTRELGVLLIPSSEQLLCSPPSDSIPFAAPHPQKKNAHTTHESMLYPPWSLFSTNSASQALPPQPIGEVNPQAIFAKLGNPELLKGVEACIYSNVIPIVKLLCGGLCEGSKLEAQIKMRVERWVGPPPPLSSAEAAAALSSALFALPAAIARAITSSLLVALSRTHGGGDSHAVTNAIFSGPGTSPPPNVGDLMPRRLVLLRHAQPTRWSMPSMGLNAATLRECPPLCLSFPPSSGIRTQSSSPPSYPFTASTVDVYEVSDALNLEAGAWVYLLAKVSHRMEILGGKGLSGETAVFRALDNLCKEYFNIIVDQLKGGQLPSSSKFYSGAADSVLRSATRAGVFPSLKDIPEGHRLLSLFPVPRQRGEVRVRFIRARGVGVVSLGDGEEEEARFFEGENRKARAAGLFTKENRPPSSVIVRAILRALLLQGVSVHSVSDIETAIASDFSAKSKDESQRASIISNRADKREEGGLVHSPSQNSNGTLKDSSGVRPRRGDGAAVSRLHRITALTRRYGLRAALPGAASGFIFSSPSIPQTFQVPSDISFSPRRSSRRLIQSTNSDLQQLSTPYGLLTPALPTSGELTLQLRAVVRSGPGQESETVGKVEVSRKFSSASEAARSADSHCWEWGRHEKVALPWDGVSPVTFSLYGGLGSASIGWGGAFLGSAALSAASLFPGIPERRTLFLLTKVSLAIPVRHGRFCGCEKSCEGALGTVKKSPIRKQEEQAEEGDAFSGETSPVPVDHFAHALRFEGPTDSEANEVVGAPPPELDKANICKWISQVVELRVGEVECELYYWPREHLTPLIPDTVRAKREERKKKTAERQ